MNRTKTRIAVALAAVLVLSVLAPVGAAAAEDDETALSVSVSDDEGPIVTVTQNDSAVAGATVDVALDENASDENASYDGVGTYATDENGTVDLPAPSEEVTVVIAASADNASATTTVELDPDGGNESAFGQLLSGFIENTDKDDVDGPFGLAVAEFVHEHNPGNAPDHAGPPADAGDNESSQGPPEHAGGDDDKGQGPPDDAGQPGDDDGDDEEEEADDEDDATGDQ